MYNLLLSVGTLVNSGIQKLAGLVPHSLPKLVLANVKPIVNIEKMQYNAIISKVIKNK